MVSFFKPVLPLIITVVMLLITAYPVAAHDGGTSGGLWHHWVWQDLPLLILIGGVYTLGLHSLWKRAGTGSGISRGRATMFGLGLIVLFVALISPLDFLSEVLFAAHMVQHLLVMLVAAPLFVLGRFTLAVAWAFPPRWSSKIWKGWKGKYAWNFLTRPVSAFLLHNAAIWIWHMPRLYEASLHNEWLHFLEHASFFLTAFLFWQVFAELTENVRMGRSAKFGMGIFMNFGTMLASGFLGVLLTFSPYVWYPTHIHETALYGLTALEDQQLAGAIMWVPSGVVYVASVLGVLGRWLFAMEALENP
ncbi:MAG TPA: cytochrome c oxidase assembly protein [Anaerolineales bacterium]|nr:cytochrome c oxidase assembly protein [Anaerolineales bacterium]